MHKSNLDEQFPEGTKVQNLKLQVCSGIMTFCYHNALEV